MTQRVLVDRNLALVSFCPHGCDFLAFEDAVVDSRVFRIDDNSFYLLTG
jgi:hypothetical protein